VKVKKSSSNISNNIIACLPIKFSAFFLNLKITKIIRFEFTTFYLIKKFKLIKKISKEEGSKNKPKIKKSRLLLGINS
jgi:hypothetical protein